MRPTTLAQAVQYISEEDNVKYFQKSVPNSNIVRKPVTNHPQNYVNHSYPTFYRPITYTQPQPTTSQFPRGPINIQRHPNPPSKKYFTNSQVFGKPQNVWKPSTSNNTNTPQNRPTPMTVSTRNTTPQFRRPVQTNYFQNNGQKPRIAAEELFNTEIDQYQNETPEYFCDEQQEYEYPYTEEAQPENFQEDLNLVEET